MAMEADDKELATLKRLVREAGVTEAQALYLVSLVGLNWSSLTREARLLVKVARLGPHSDG